MSRGRGRSHSRGRSGSRGGRDRSRSQPKGEVSSEVMSLDTREIAYLLGRNGSTKQRLANFSGARLEVDHRSDGGRIEVIGTPEERELARLCVDITLQQRNCGKVLIDVDKLESRKDTDWIDVPKDVVGFLMGAKGATLRGFELKYRTFMFFDTEVLHQGKRRLYVLGPDDGRRGAIDEAESAMKYKMSGNGTLRSWREYCNSEAGPRYTEDYTRVRRSGSRDRDRSRGRRRSSRSRSRSSPRRRSPPRRRSRDRDDRRRSRSRSPRRHDDRR